MLTRLAVGFLKRRSKALSREGLSEWLDAEICSLESEARSRSLTTLSVGAGGEIGELIGTKPVLRARQVDIDPSRKPDIVADVCRMPMIEADAIDVVLMVEVLEHVRTPRAALKEVHRVIKPGGRLLLSTPMLMPIHDAPHDYFRFTKYGLVDLLRDFEQVEIAPRNGYYAAVLTLFGRAMNVSDRQSAIIAMLAFSFALLLSPIFRLMDRFYSGDAGTTGYVVSARKPTLP